MFTAGEERGVLVKLNSIVGLGAEKIGDTRNALWTNRAVWRETAKIAVLVCLLVCGLRPAFADGDEVDPDRLHVRANWWFSLPSGYFKSSANEGGDQIDLHRDLGFGSYSTFSGNVDWRFARKHHLLLLVSPVNSSRRTTLSRTIDWQGNTYDAGVTVDTDVHSFLFAPGYEWDFIKRSQWALGVIAQFNILDTSATITGTATVNGQTATRTSKGSVIAPIPAVGPRVKFFPIEGSRKFDVDAGLQGMYLFGYGDFWAGRASADWAFSRHWYVSGGYQLGTRLSVHGSDNQIGIRLTQKGPVAGVMASW
jgi:hypothetical protein